MNEFLLSNWAELLLGVMAFVKIVVNLTPTEKDNKVFEKLDAVINLLIKDRRKK